MTPLEGSPGQLPTEALRPRSIPRIFHQTWRDENIDEHSDFAAESQAAIRRFHPGYEDRFWTDRDIGHFMRREVKPAFPDLFDTYERLPKKIMKIDFVRLCWMYLLGGVYCDLDVIHLRSADELIAPGGVVFIGRGWMTGRFIAPNQCSSGMARQLPPASGVAEDHAGSSVVNSMTVSPKRSN